MWNINYLYLFVDDFPIGFHGFTLGFPHLSVRLSWGNIYSHLLPSLCPPALQEALQVLQSMTRFGLLGDAPWREHSGKNQRKSARFSMILMGFPGYLDMMVGGKGVCDCWWLLRMLWMIGIRIRGHQSPVVFFHISWDAELAVSHIFAAQAVTFSSLLAACAKAREIKCAEHVCHGEVVGV